MPEFKWLPCRVREGMFSDESLIELIWPGRGPRYYFVPKTNVRFENGQHGAVRVRVVTHAGGPWAVLPTPEYTMIPVQDADLVAA